MLYIATATDYAACWVGECYPHAENDDEALEKAQEIFDERQIPWSFIEVSPIYVMGDK